jgi:hypothetical protein
MNAKTLFCIQLSILLLIINGCFGVKEGKFKRILQKDFPKKVELKGVQLLEDEPVILTSGLIDSLLFFESFGDTVFHVFNRNEKAVAKFGMKGRGPGEFSSPPKISQIWSEDDGVKLLAIDNTKKHLVEINMSASVIQNKIIVNRSFKIPMDLLGLRDVFKISENKYTGVYDDRPYNKLNGNRGVFIYDMSKDSIEIFPLLNLKLTPSNDVVNEMNLNTRIVEKNPGRTEMIMAFRYMPLVEIFDFEKKEIVKRFLFESDLPDTTFSLEELKNGKLTRYFENIYVTNDKIYLLKIGQPENSDASDQTILVMDWDGNPLGSYLIPKEYDLSQIIVDESKGIMYGINFKRFNMYKFNI